MKARGKEIKKITNFWGDVKFKQCKCGKKEVIHGFCQECWDSGGREKVIAAAQRERDKLHEERHNAHKQHLRLIMGL